MATQLFLMRLSGVSSKVTCRFSPVRCGISWGRRRNGVTGPGVSLLQPYRLDRLLLSPGSSTSPAAGHTAFSFTDSSRHPVQPSQYTLFSGTTPRTPPRGSSTSRAYRGMTWTWRCITVWPAALPALKPSGWNRPSRRIFASRRRAWRAASSASKNFATCRKGSSRQGNSPCR